MELSPVKPGWKLEKQPATRAKDTEKLRQIAARVLRVLDDMSRQDEIEGRRLEGKIFSIVQPREETFQSFEAPTTKLETQWVHLDAVDGSRSPLPSDKHLAADTHPEDEHGGALRKDLLRDFRRDVSETIPHPVQRHGGGDGLRRVPVPEFLVVSG
jgi:hypothetical protein